MSRVENIYNKYKYFEVIDYNDFNNKYIFL